MKKLCDLTEQQLEARVVELGRIQKSALIEFVLCLGELHRRRLHLAAGFETIADYCRVVLKEERRRAWRLRLAAEAVAEFPLARELLATEKVSVSALIAVKPALTRENHADLLTAAVGLTEDDAEMLASQFRPRPPRTDSVRVVHRFEPAPFPATPAGAPPPAPAEMRCGPAPAVPPPAPFDMVLVERYEIKATVSKQVRAQLDDVRSALSHQIPDGNLNDILAECFRLTLEACAKRKLGAGVPFVRVAGSATAGGPAQTPPSPSADPNPTGKGEVASLPPGPSGKPPTSGERPVMVKTWPADFGRRFGACIDRSRHIPAAVRRAVWIRDEGCCSYRGPDGHRCSSRYQLEFDHWHAFSLGGEHTIDNVRVLCARPEGSPRSRARTRSNSDHLRACA